MATLPDRLELHLHLTDGSTDKFVQDHPDAVAEVLNKIQPLKLFAQRQFTVITRDAVYAWPCSAVEYVEAIMAAAPTSWVVAMPRDMRILGSDEFEAARRTAAERAVEYQGLQRGDEFVGSGEIEMVSGAKHWIETRNRVASSLDQRMALAQIFQSGTLPVKLRGGGMGFLNTQHIVRVAMFPGPPGVAREAWPLEWLW